MTKYIFLFLLVALVAVFIVDLSTVIMAGFIYFLGLAIIVLANWMNSRKLTPIIKIYQVVFTAGFIYICICYLYMSAHGYNFLLAQDIASYFLPVAESLLEHGSISRAEVENWKGYSFFSRYHYGYFGYLIPFGYLSSYLGANFYVSMQFSTLLVASLSSVIIFKLLTVNQIDHKRAYKYTLVICLFSVIFFYSTQLLRDIHIMFLYLLGIYLTFKTDFSISNLIKIFLIILTSCTLRIETGIYLFYLVPLYLLLTIKYSKNRIIPVLISFVVATGGIIFSGIYFNEFLRVFTQNNEIYLESDKGSGVVGSLQNIPLVGKFLSVAYNAIQPLPFWSKYTATIKDNRPEIFNLMTFPLSFATLLNFIVLFFILVFLFHSKTRARVSQHIPKPLVYHLYFGFIFLYLQSAVIDQRRLMAFYVIFYIFFYIIYTNITISDRKKLMLIAVSSYTVLQAFALFYKI